MSDWFKDLFIDEAKAALAGLSPGGGGGPGGEWKPIGDGNTHLWISLLEGRTSPMLGVCPNGTVTVDWGDGTTPDVLTGTHTNQVKWTPIHEYGKAGDYVITLTVDGEMGIRGFYSSDHYTYLLRYSETATGRNTIYQRALQRVELGNGVTNLGESAFDGCYNLKSVNIPNSITTVGSYSFRNCSRLTSIDIPNSVTRIYSLAFHGCTSLTSISIPSSVTSISTGAFKQCNSITSISIPSSVTSIGSEAFQYLDELTSISIPSSITSIASSTFAVNRRITSISIPSSVTSIGSYAFYNCIAMRFYDFTKHTTVPTLDSVDAFTSIASDCEIRVPAALVDEWKAATNWATYADYIVGV